MKEMKKLQKHRVGTFTAAWLLIGFGILFIIHLIEPAFEYYFIFQCWPAVFILLGLEMLYASFRMEEVVYDTGAIFLVFVMTIFAMGMASADWILRYIVRTGYWHRL